jgi:hypothetical protein
MTKPLKYEPCPHCGKKMVEFSTMCLGYIFCPRCGLLGPDNDPQGKKWNSLPRRKKGKVKKI